MALSGGDRPLGGGTSWKVLSLWSHALKGDPMPLLESRAIGTSSLGLEPKVP